MSSEQPGNLRILFGLSKEKKVLAIGDNGMRKYIESLRPVEFYQNLSEIEQAEPIFDCILFNVDNFQKKERMKYEFERAVALLKRDGIIFLLNSNYFSPYLFFSLIKAVIYGNKSQGFPNWWSNYRIAQTLFQLLSYPHNSVKYLPLPWGAEELDQFPQADTMLLGKSSQYGKVVSTLQKLNVYKFLHPGYLSVRSLEPVEDNLLFKEISACLKVFLNSNSCHLKLEKFDLRDRGALIAFIQEMNSGNYFIARVVSGKKVDSIVKKNQAFIKFIHFNHEISQEIKAKIPLPVSELSLQDSKIYIENCIEGVLGWKLLRKRNAERMLSESATFITTFNLATKIKKTLDKIIWSQLFDEDKLRFERAPVEKELKNQICNFLDLVKKRFEGVKLTFVVSHGDFGYGNILFNPSDCKLTGVIDWDTGRKLEFPAIDFLNLLIQQERSQGASLFHAAQIVMDQIKSKSYCSYLKAYFQVFELTESESAILLGITIIRYMSRASQYETVFLKEQTDYLKIMQKYGECFKL